MMRTVASEAPTRHFVFVDNRVQSCDRANETIYADTKGALHVWRPGGYVPVRAVPPRLSGDPRAVETVYVTEEFRRSTWA